MDPEMTSPVGRTVQEARDKHYAESAEYRSAYDAIVVEKIETLRSHFRLLVARGADPLRVNMIERQIDELLEIVKS